MPDYEPLDYRLRCHSKRTDLPPDVLRDICEAYETIQRLTKERDEARRYSCDLEARIIVLEEDRRDTSNKFGTNPCSEIILPDYPLAREPKEIAKQKGWDCFKDNA
jgi:hypothetical protein